MALIAFVIAGSRTVLGRLRHIRTSPDDETFALIRRTKYVSFQYARIYNILGMCDRQNKRSSSIVGNVKISYIHKFYDCVLPCSQVCV